MKCDIVLVDFSWLLHNKYYAFEKNGAFRKQTEAGHIYYGQVYGLASTIKALHIYFDNPVIIMCMDGKHGKDFRRKLFPEYKKHRTYKPEIHAMEEETCKVSSLFHNILFVQNPIMEADDLMASLYFQLSAEGNKCVILTNDNDMLQLIPQGANIICNIKQESVETKDKDYIFKKFEVLPEHLLMFRSVIGDSSDNIPPIVPRISRKFVREFVLLWRETKSFEEATQQFNADTKTKLKFINLIKEHEDDILRNMKIMSLQRYKKRYIDYMIREYNSNINMLYEYNLQGFIPFINSYNGVVDENKNRIIRRTKERSQILHS